VQVVTHRISSIVPRKEQPGRVGTKEAEERKGIVPEPAPLLLLSAGESHFSVIDTDRRIAERGWWPLAPVAATADEELAAIMGAPPVATLTRRSECSTHGASNKSKESRTWL
jgi:hypothetical protein